MKKLNRLFAIGFLFALITLSGQATNGKENKTTATSTKTEEQQVTATQRSKNREVKTGEIVFKKDKLIEVALLTVKPGKEKQFNEDYFKKAFPIGVPYGARFIGSFMIKKKDAGNVPAQMLIFFEWNSLEDFRKLKANIDFVKVVNIRNDALSFLTTGTFKVDKDITYKLSSDKTYEFAALWLTNPPLLQEYFKAVLPLAGDPKIQFQLIAQLKSTGESDGTYHPHLIFFSEWKAGYKGKKELLRRKAFKDNVQKREKASPYKDILIVIPML